MPTNNDIAIKIVKMEADIGAIRQEVSYSGEMSRQEMSGVKSAVEKIGEAVALLLKSSQETALLRKDLSETQHDVNELSERMDKRQAVTDPVILEAKEFLASFKTGAALVVKGLTLLQLLFVMWLGYNETRISALETQVHNLTIASAARTSVLNVQRAQEHSQPK